MGGPWGLSFITTVGGKSALTPASTYLLSPSCSLGTLDEGPGQPLPMPATFPSFLAITWPHPTLDLTKAVFTEVDGRCWITLCTSLSAVLVVEVLIWGLDLSEADRVVSAPDEETVMVGTIPPITMWDVNGQEAPLPKEMIPHHLHPVGMVGLLDLGKEVERSISSESNKKG